VGKGANSLLDQTKEGKMRKLTLMLAAMGLMVSLFAAVAYAATIEGTDQSEVLLESDRNDTIHGKAGGDIIDASIFVGDRDEVKGNRGSDTIYVDDGDNRDTAIGGKGFDRCFGDPGDDLNCEVESF
jgi:Ca2+-binding RTX toxin-like protein